MWGGIGSFPSSVGIGSIQYGNYGLLWPLTIPYGFTYSMIQMEVQTAGAVGTGLTFSGAIYLDVDGLPTTLVTTIPDFSAASTGFKQFIQSGTFSQGSKYWLGLILKFSNIGSCNLRSASNTNPIIGSYASFQGSQTYLRTLATISSFPSSFSSSQYSYGYGATVGPLSCPLVTFIK
jgi:hypothetical protein